MIAMMVFAIAMSDCPAVKPGFEWLLGISCAAKLNGGNSRLPNVQAKPSPSPSPPSGGNPGGNPGNPGNGNGKGHGHGKGKNK